MKVKVITKIVYLFYENFQKHKTPATSESSFQLNKLKVLLKTLNYFHKHKLRWGIKFLFPSEYQEGNICQKTKLRWKSIQSKALCFRIKAISDNRIVINTDDDEANVRKMHRGFVKGQQWTEVFDHESQTATNLLWLSQS